MWLLDNRITATSKDVDLLIEVYDKDKDGKVSYLEVLWVAILIG